MRDYIDLFLKRAAVEILSLRSAIRRGRLVWSVDQVAGDDPPALAVRNYLESRLIRSALSDLGAFDRALDFGCGYGRLSMVLQEFARDVYGVEREPQLVSVARGLLPSIRFFRVGSLTDLPFADEFFDITLSFTVLQHVPDSVAPAAVEELKRVTGTGFILLVEETEPRVLATHIGRSVDTYRRWMLPYELVRCEERRMEPTYRREKAGHAMLFQLE
ncbi:MAG: class I SAM-dependent methyltransferase [Candidatus Geothermarchaeales archaeon]